MQKYVIKHYTYFRKWGNVDNWMMKYKEDNI